MPYSVYVIEDHPIFYEGLYGVIDREADFDVIGCAPDAGTARDQLSAKRPDIIILDLGLPDGSGFDLIDFAKSVRPEQKILVLSGLDKSLYACRAIRSGARGFLSKDMAATRVVEAIRTILRGEVYLDHEVQQQMLAKSVGQAPEETDPLSALSDRELDVYRLIGRGLTMQEIADCLFLSPKTVETYRAHVKRKLGLANSRELIRDATMWCLQEARPAAPKKNAA